MNTGCWFSNIPSLKLTYPWKLMVGRWNSFWEGLFSGAMLVSGRVIPNKDCKHQWNESITLSIARFVQGVAEDGYQSLKPAIISGESKELCILAIFCVCSWEKNVLLCQKIKIRITAGLNEISWMFPHMFLIQYSSRSIQTIVKLTWQSNSDCLNHWNPSKDQSLRIFFWILTWTHDSRTNPQVSTVWYLNIYGRDSKKKLG